MAVLRRLQRPAGTPQLDAKNLLQIAASQHLKSAETRKSHTRTLLEALYGLPFVQALAEANRQEGMACLHSAEAAALAYEALGVLDSSAVQAEAYTVRDFTDQPPLRSGYSLRTRIRITLPKHAAR